jgi:tRNA(fMet)-specific endonuclease VapC
VTDPRYLLDSNICIYLLEGLSVPARVRAERCVPGELATSSICCAEVLKGIDPSDMGAMRAVDALFRVCVVLPFDEVAARAYQLVPFRRARFDRLIGAHALALGITVVTNNEEEFADIPGLTIANWTLPL